MKMTTHDAAAGGDPGVGLALEWAIQAEDHAKARWRAFCAAFWGWMQLALRAAPPRACPFPGLAVVLVEFRAECVTSACFVILQALRQLGRVPVHVVCGPANQDALEARLRPLEAWSGGLRLHALPEARRADVGFYTRLLLSAGFWERFPQDRLLLMQEDSCLFHGRLGPFLKYDYVGAPWAHRENRHDVGNGGFSLRSRQAMLRVLHALQGDFSNIMSPHAQRHWRGSAQYPPEDVVFANTLLRHPRLGTVAPRAAALYFSQELVPSPPTVLGGHTWWLHTLRTRRTSYSLLGVLCRLFPVAVVASPYTYSMGGGEKYLSHLLHALTSAPGGRALFPLVCSVSDTSQVRDTLRRLQLPGAWADRVRVCPWDHLRAYCRDLPHPLWRPHTLVHMHNASVPAVPAVGRARNWLHCQFPFDLDQPPGARASQARDLAAYHKIIVNSPFTAAHLRRRYGQMGAPPAVSKRIEVVYPWATTSATTWRCAPSTRCTRWARRRRPSPSWARAPTQSGRRSCAAASGPRASRWWSMPAKNKKTRACAARRRCSTSRAWRTRDPRTRNTLVLCSSKPWRRGARRCATAGASPASGCRTPTWWTRKKRWCAACATPPRRRRCSATSRPSRTRPSPPPCAGSREHH